MLIPKWIPETQVCQWTKRFLKKKVFKIMFVGFLSSNATIEPLESSGNFKNNVDVDASGEKQKPENQVLNCPPTPPKIAAVNLPIQECQM